MARADQRKFHYIYKITRNDGSGKYYIGMHSTDDLEDGYFGSGTLLWHSIKKHGKEKHVMEVLEYLPNRTSLRLREKELVNEELLRDPLCMNIKKGGDGGAQTNPSVLKTLSNKAKLRVGEKNSFYGKKHTPTAKQKIAESREGKPLSETVKVKLSEKLRGRSGEWFHSEETKHKLKMAWEHRRQTPVSEETRMKMAAAKCGSSRTFKLVSPTGETFITNDLIAFCKAHGLAYSSITACLRDGKPLGGRNSGWQIAISI